MPGTGKITEDIEDVDMKAFLLSAGLGTRLRPLTDTVPKCLVPIKGKPLLTYWIELFERHSITDVLINTHYLHAQVHDYIKQHNISRKNPHIREFYEPELLGSGGTVSANRDFVVDEEFFFICYADNLTNIDLTAMLNFHIKHNSPFTMALFRAANPSQCGIVDLDKDNRIIKFEEKPQNPKSNLANAGLYIAGNNLFEKFPHRSFIDFGKDIIPLLAGNMYGWETSDYLIDIGTPNNYKKAQEDIKWIIQRI